MGWFTKKDKGEIKREPNLDLPELPKLPELPRLEEESKPEKVQNIHKLPSFPSSPLGKKISQSTIKDAVTGKKEVEGFGTNDFAPKNEIMQTMPKALKIPVTKEVGFEEPRIPEKISRIPPMKRVEPVFIRIDKFEESLQIFEKAKTQISEIEKMLSHIKKVKEEEEKELVFWEGEMQKIKNQIQKVDQDLFSKI